MRLKILLFALLLTGGIYNTQAGVANADQDTIKGLIITEAQMGNQPDGYFEITNMGAEAINLNVIEWGEIRPWGPPPWEPIPTRHFMLPDFVLEPGATFVLASAFDFNPEQFAKGVTKGYSEKVTKDDMWKLADMLIHVKEFNSIPGLDSIDANGGAEMFGDISNGRSCFFIRQHINETDSVVLDQVGGVFDGPDGLNKGYPFDVAGVSGATANSYLIRKYSVKTGNLDFANARGVGEDDSEWIVIPKPRGSSPIPYRRAIWTIGNHGNYVLDENTLESTIADIDFAAKTITVPWGTRRGDDIMSLMKKKPGIAWTYIVSPVQEDSLAFAAKTGDQIEIIVCGDVATKAVFDITVAEPTEDANMVVPVIDPDPMGFWRNSHENGEISWPRVTRHESGIDTIWGLQGGIPYATRTDSLLEQLEKPANATWEFEWVDGVAHPDIKEGDKLKVTSANGTVKSYYIRVNPIIKNDDAILTSITWPDIPEFYEGLFGWIGDTIPGFGPTVYNYRVQVPLDVDGTPHLVATASSANAKIAVDRAANLNGTPEDRTVTFTVTAESDTTQNIYKVELNKEKDPRNIQPFKADPFISEYVFWEQWSNSFMEICNPGNQPLDLSNYMIVGSWSADPAGAIQSQMLPENWMDRYDKYIPGYKWVDEGTWQANPGIVTTDLNINPIVMPGDVFTLGYISQDAFAKIPWMPDYVWPVPNQLDIQFNNYEGNLANYSNPWGEQLGWGSGIHKWNSSSMYLFKILNDSIKQGLKPANDPNDFELIDVFAMGDGTAWTVGGVAPNMLTNWSRKPEYYKGNPVPAASFGTTPEDAEWTWTNQAYWQAHGAGWPFWTINCSNDIGKHFFNTPTHYMSTVSSVIYKVSEGYSMKESIKGMVTGTTASDFLANIIKTNEKQTLTVKSTADGSELPGDAVLSMNDTLVVLSADSVNTTKYILEVSDGGLSSDALLTSSKYEITVDGSTGEISKFEYGTSLKTIVANINVPAGASLDIIDGAGAYVPLTRLNYDTTTVNVTVNDNIYLHVTAEDGVTKITYQLKPTAGDKDAFVTSDVYNVIQKEVLIEFVPRGTNVQSFLNNLVVSSGATMQLVNKMGQPRLDGNVADDDKIIVTARDGVHTRVYYIAMLAEKYVPANTYLAYILSRTYQVDQVNYVVNGVSGDETIANFYSKITPATGATAVVIDKNGNEKTSGDIDGTDKVQVTSADGKVVVIYTFGSLTATDIVEVHNIEIYPNPTNGHLNISGVERGNRIQIFNSTGAAIRNIIVQSSTESVSIEREPAGMYMIVISDSNKLLGRFKAIKN
jgi:hypothetical protein